MRVLSSRGSQLESAFAFGVVRQLFEPEMAEPLRRDELLRGAAVGASGVFDFAESRAEQHARDLLGLPGDEGLARAS